MATRKRPTKLERAIERAEYFVATNRRSDDFAGEVADEILGPVLRELKRLQLGNERLRRDVSRLLNRPSNRGE